jgi:hypothetical protein
MEKFWNYIYYSIYLLESNITLFFRRILNFIFHPLTRVSYLKNSLEKKGSSFENIDNVAIRALNDPRYGKSITIAGIQMGGLLILIEYTLFNFLQVILNKSLIQHVWEDHLYRWIFLIGLLIIPGIINYIFLWKDDKYLEYFKKIEKEPKSIKHKWFWISFGFVIGTFFLIALSFWLVTELI